MDNHAYVNMRRYSSSKSFEQAAKEIFSERPSTDAYPGSIIQWLDDDADIALSFPKGSLVEWDETQDECEDPRLRRSGIYGLVLKQSTVGGHALKAIVVSTTDKSGRRTEKFLHLENQPYNVRKSSIPDEVVDIVRAKVLQDEIEQKGNRL